MRKSTIIFSLFLLLGGANIYAQKITVTYGANGTAGFAGDGGSSVKAMINTPYDLCLDAAHNIYFTDMGNNRVRKISARTGVITTVAGGGTSTADGVPATSEALAALHYIAIDASGNLYIPEGSVNKVRKIDAVTGMISTVAGTGTGGYSGDGGPANAAKISGPQGICVDGAGNIYLVDAGNNRIRKIDALTGIISTIAGTGTAGYTGDGGAAVAAEISNATAICVNTGGDLYFSDQSTTRIRKIAAGSGLITAVAGHGSGIYGTGNGGLAVNACIGNVHEVAVDGTGDIFICDDSCACRKIDVLTGIISVVAGDTISEGYNGDNGNAYLIYYNYPTGVRVDERGNVYVADKSNNRIRKSIQLTSKPTYAFGEGQSITMCPGYAYRIDSVLAAADLDTLQTETWTVLTPPANGILTGFPASALSGGRSKLAYAPGTFYTPNLSYMGADSFQVRVSDGTLSDTVMVYVNAALPDAGIVTGLSSVCAGTTITLSASVAGGAWSMTNANANISAGSVNGVNAGVDTAVYTVTGVGGCMASASMPVTVHALPDAGLIASPDSICLGSSITATESVSGGTWSVTGTAATINSSGLLTGTTYGTSIINYTVNDGTCTNTELQMIFVNTSAMPITGATIVCLGSSITLNDGVPGGAWSLSNGTASVSVTSPSSLTVTGVSSGSDTVTYVNTNTCGMATETKIISVDPTPVAGAISGIPNLCVGAGFHFTETASGGAWSVSNSDAHIGPAGMLTANVAGTDTVIYTVSNACHSVTATYVLTIAATPTAGTVSGPAEVCEGTTITLSDDIAGGVWSTGNGNASISGSGDVMGLSVGTDSVYYSVTNSCGTATSSTLVNIAALPNAGTITGTDNNVCIGGSILLVDAAPGGMWAAANGNATVAGSGIIVGVSAGADTITYQVTNSCGTAVAKMGITVTDCGATGVPSMSTPSLTIYPNPASSVLNIAWENLQDKDADVVFTDMAGREILKTTFHNDNGSGAMQQDLSSFGDGIYLLTINSSTLHYTGKIVVDHK